MSDSSKNLLVKIPPLMYLHVLNRNSQVVRVEIGPQTFFCRQEEQVLTGPTNMIVIPPRHYTIIENPVVRDQDGRVVLDRFGQAKLRHGDEEVRESQEPFPLWPGERVKLGVQPLLIVEANTALRVQAVRDFEEVLDAPVTDVKQAPARIKVSRPAGSEWLFLGPSTFHPSPNTRIVHTIKAQVLQTGEALRLRARKDMTDAHQVPRRAGEEWLYRREGLYMPLVDEQVLGVEKGYILSEKNALHLVASDTFVDIFDKRRLAGDQWLVTRADSEVYIPDVHERVVSQVSLVSLTKRQYCIIRHPYHAVRHVPVWGAQRVQRGVGDEHVDNFFLRPGEELVTQAEVIVLGEDEALRLRAVQEFDEHVPNSTKTVRRRPGEVYYLYGPAEYWPSLEAKIDRRIRAIRVEGLRVYLFRPEKVLVALFALVALLVLRYVLF